MTLFLTTSQRSWDVVLRLTFFPNGGGGGGPPPPRLLCANLVCESFHQGSLKVAEICQFPRTALPHAASPIALPA
jgi:hypothetical protein